MPRSTREPLTAREAQIMTALWDTGVATADQVREALPDDLHDSTVRTLLRVLERKGYVTHRTERRTFIYAPVVERSRVQQTALRAFLRRFFGGSAEALVLRLLEDEHMTLEKLQALKAKTSTGRRDRRR